jgi:hypothetical protein
MYKKIHIITGTVDMPLYAGRTALIYTNEGKVIRTSRVVAVNQITNSVVIFETLNSTYYVNLGFSPEPAVVGFQTSVCAA